jgi:hypothetical protein
MTMKKSIRAAFMDAALSEGKKSTRTRVERHRLFARLEAFAKEHRFHQMTPQTMTLKQVKMFIDSTCETASPRAMQNIMSHIRTAVRGAGRAHVADSPEWGNKALNLESEPGDRTGQHRALSESELQAAYAKAATLGAPGRELVALAELQRSIGLRAQEAVQSAGSLAAWKAALEGGRPLLVSKGTKGGRARTTVIPEPLRERAQRAVDAALALSRENGGKLVPSTSLKGALDRYSHACVDVGLRGDASSHALRVSFAHDAYHAYIKQGYAEAAALSALSCDLGHGDGRGRYVKGIYCRELFE